MKIGKTLADSYHCLTPSSNIDLSSFPWFQVACGEKAECHYAGHAYFYRRFNEKDIVNFVHVTHKLTYVKMLDFFRDGKSRSYRELCDKLFPTKCYGHDIDLFKHLLNKKMVAFVGNKGRLKLYAITDFGRDILRIADANNVYYKPLRWFMIDNEDERTTAMLKADMDGTANTYAETSTESILDLLKAIFSKDSDITKICSRYRWFNQFVGLLKRSSSFYDACHKPEIEAWLVEQASSSPEVARFLKIWKARRRPNRR